MRRLYSLRIRPTCHARSLPGMWRNTLIHEEPPYMKRRAFNVLTAISALLLVGVVSLWTRSYWRYDHLSSVLDSTAEDKWTRSFYDLDSSRGEIIFACMRETATDQLNIDAYRNDPTVPHFRWSYLRAGDKPWREESHSDNADLIHRCGVVIDAGIVHEGDWPPYYLLTVVAPHWLLMPAFAVLPAMWFIGYWRRRRHDQHGRCPTCGYDLRATPDRCPECGNSVAAVELERVDA